MESHAAPTPARRPDGRTAAALALVPLGLVAAYAAIPGAREALTREDGPIEWTAAILFLAAGITGIVRLATCRPPEPWSWLLPAAGLVGFGEETAYGARIFGLPLPTVAGQQVDGLHDVFDVAERVLADLGVRRLHAAGVAVAAAIALLAVAHRRGLVRRAGTWVRAHRPVAIVTASVTISVVAVGFDLLGGTTTTRLVEEVLEVTAAALLLYGAARIGTVDRRETPAFARKIS